MRLSFLKPRRREAGSPTITAADLESAYRFFLARPPESGVLDQTANIAVTVQALIKRFVTSGEFGDNFAKPILRGRPATAGYQIEPDLALVGWAVGLASVSAETSATMLQADTLADAIEAFLRDPAVHAQADTPEIQRLGQKLLERAANRKSAPRGDLAQLGLATYPSAFLWFAYARRGSGRGGNKWQALRHLLRHGGSDGRIPPSRGEGRGEFLAALGRHFAGRNDVYALTLLDIAASEVPLDGRQLEALGSVCRRLGQPARAVAAFREALATGRRSVAMLRDAVAAAIEIEDVEWARSLLHQHQAEFAGEIAWREMVSVLAEADFALSSDAASAAYEAGTRAEADAILADSIRRIVDDFQVLGQFGAPVPPDGLRRVLMLANGDLPQCKYYRIDQKVEYLDLIGRIPIVCPLADSDRLINELPGAEALIVYRYPAWPSVIRVILAANALGVPVFYEIDDLIFDAKHYPDNYASYGEQITYGDYLSLQSGVPLFMAALRLCDYGIASTEPLAAEMRRHVRSGEVWVSPNGISSRIEHAERLAARRPSDVVTVFYGTGTRAHNSDFDELVAPALSLLLEQYCNVRVIIAGYLTLPEFLSKFGDRIVFVDFLSPIEEYWRLLKMADINVAVLKPSTMADCKSEIKWLEAAAFGIPSVVSPTESYRASLNDGRDVLFAATVDEWASSLGRLIEDPDLRCRIGGEARMLAMTAFSPASVASTLELALAAVRPHGISQKPRLLVVNVFFPPQTLGGATRVVRDNVDYLIAAGFLDHVDLAVLTSDLGVAPEGKVRVDSYRGVPVFRISTPEHEHMDWRDANPLLGARVSAIHGLWMPDLVHYHCVQRLTGSAVDVALRTGVPYLITAHDAWWISDHQFLVDEEGVVLDPVREAVEPSPPLGISLECSLKRRTHLRGLLDGAEQVLCVSEAFSSLYRAAGVANVRTVANGLPPLRVVPRRPSMDGRVRIAHVGNVTPHKGLPLVREALSGAQLSRLVLTVVDHSRSDESAVTEIWGETEVRIVGKRSQDRMAEFYAEHDVLLAPSIWPESFGLVTREAKAAGLWVIASNRGAIGDDVRDGVDGFVVSVEDAAPLRGALAKINTAPERFLHPPPTSPQRTSADQSRELMQLYLEILSVRGEAAYRVES